MDNDIHEHRLNINRRHFLGKLGLGVGSAALSAALLPKLFEGIGGSEEQALAGVTHFAPKAKRIIMLFQNGAPSQLESFDYKPLLNKMFNQDLPESIRGTQRLTGMTSNQECFLLVGSKFGFK